MMNIRVSLPGHGRFWLLTHPGDGDRLTSGPLAPDEHVDADGNLNLEDAFSVSYAHLFEDGSIMRYRKKIGTREDLVRL